MASVGIVGLGFAGFEHLRVYDSLPGVKICAVSDPDPARVAEARRRYSGVQGFPDGSALLDTAAPDVVSVTTPTHLHAATAIAALRAGSHVLCEKPMAMNAVEAAAMNLAARESGRLLEICFNNRHRADIAALRDVVASGRLGRVYAADAFWTRRSGIPGLRSWMTNRELSGGGALIDIGVHMLDALLFVLDEPEVTAVSAHTSSEFGPRGRGGNPRTSPRHQVHDEFDVEDSARVLLRLTDGRRAGLDISWAGHQRHDNVLGLHVRGTRGGADLVSIDYSQADTVTVLTEEDEAPVVADLGNAVDPHAAAIRAFLSRVRAGETRSPAADQGEYRTRILDACYRSTREGREVRLSP